jgi:hypothetical protein
MCCLPLSSEFDLIDELSNEAVSVFVVSFEFVYESSILNDLLFVSLVAFEFVRDLDLVRDASLVLDIESDSRFSSLELLLCPTVLPFDRPYPIEDILESLFDDDSVFVLLSEFENVLLQFSSSVREFVVELL